MKAIIHRCGKVAAGLLAASAVLAFSTLSALAAPQSTTSAGTGEIPFESYTYWEDYGAGDKTPVYCKPMYKVKTVIDGAALGTGALQSVADVCADENGQVYILDSGASKIYITDSSYRPVSQIDAIVYQGKTLSVEGAGGIFVRAGHIYVADTKRGRVLVLGPEGVVTRFLPLPESRLIPADFTYRPVKVAVDSKGYTYIASDGSYYGALLYSPEMEFLGFFGANTVQASVPDVLKNLFDRLFSNDIKKGASVLALPYQFNDLVPGPMDFIYTATGKSNDRRIQTGQVSMMNPGGRNVLGKESFNFADVSVGTYKRFRQIQSITGIDVDSDGFFYIADAAYGRVFWYDKECNLLSVFGGGVGPRRQKGTLPLANAIAVNGADVLVSDGMKNSVTVFEMTEYGGLVRGAQLKALNNDFEDSVDGWGNVIARDQNSQLAYRGLAKAYFFQGDYGAAAKYAKLGADRDIYGKAFSKTRTALLERWFPALFGGVLALAAALTAFIIIQRKKNSRLIKSEKVRVMASSVPHPFESFQLVREKQLGSAPIAAALLLLYYLGAALTDRLAGFAFNHFDASSYNSFYVLLSTAGLVLLWTGANWLVCVLLGGIGKLREIFIVTCYSLIPMIFASAVSLACTHLLTPDEFVFIGILQTVCTLYALFMLTAGTIKVHDFSFGKFAGTSVLTVIAMVIIVFLLFLVFLLSQQIYGWFYTLFVEAKYR